jgi:hypothetical protein
MIGESRPRRLTVSLGSQAERGENDEKDKNLQWIIY